METVVRAAGPAELEAAAAVLAEAFADDPVLAEFRPPRTGEDRPAVLTGLFAALIRSVPSTGRRVDVATIGDRVVGAAFWQAPGRQRGGVRAFVWQVPAFLRTLGLGGALRALAHLRRMERARPVTPHWYLAEIGVAASARGRGIGGLLLGHALEHADRTSDGAYLESSTPVNRRLYRRHGFTDGAPIAGFRAAAPIGMWRPAAG